MDQRLIVTAALVAHLVAGAMLGLAASVADVPYSVGQVEFLVIVGYVTPLAGLGLVWARSYVYGAVLLTCSAIANGWFVAHFGFVGPSPTNVAAVDGSASAAYLYATVAVFLASLVLAGTGAWLWYRESEGFRTVVHDFVRPPGNDGTRD